MSTKILVIDDEPVIRQVFQYYLEDNDFEVVTAEDGEKGLEQFHKHHPQIVLTDLRMPRTDGLEVLGQIREYNVDLPVIVISGANRLDDAVQALRLGAWDYLIKPVQDLSILQHTIERALEKAALIRENKQYREHLEDLVRNRTEELEKRNRELDISRRQIIGILSQAAEYKDFETGNHFLRVAEYAGCLARGLGLNRDEVEIIKLAAPVHDIGKIGIPDNVLLKKGKLDPEEWAKMQEHCRYGHKILTENKFIEAFINEEKRDSLTKELHTNIIAKAANIALNHHEHWDGGGYPLGIKGEAIPLEARITAVADVFDALSSERPYKKAWPLENCIDYISSEREKHFDPEVVDVFLENIELIRSIRESIT